jgi:hypothetical protein
VLLAVAPYLHRTVASAAVIVTAISVLSWSLFRGWQNRSRMGALLASMYLPFFWMVLYSRPFGHASGLIEWLPLGPAIVCAAFAGGQIDDGAGISAAIIIIELFVGAWLIRRNGKLSLACLILVLLFSCFSSFILHALYRA